MSINTVTTKHRKLKTWQRTVSILAIVVLLCASYAMILPTITAGGAYVGYSKVTTDLDAFEFARLEGGVGVKKFYLASKAVYDQYANMTNPTYADQEKLIATSEVAYCFNYYKAPPTDTFNPSERSEYDENENSSASLFYNATSSHVRIKDANKLYEKILSVALNGYPNDYSGIQAKYGLSDDVFRAITQYAIWYYTDSISIYTYNYTNYYMYADDTYTWLTKNNGKYTAIPFTNTDADWLDAYIELRDTLLNSSTMNTSHINLFENTTGDYQHLLTVTQNNSTTPPSPETLSASELKTQITAKKTIDDGQTDIGSNKFKFRLTGNGQDVTVENDKNGDILFPEITYTQPGTYTYTIEEVTDERDGVSFDFDKSKKTVTVTINSQAVQTFDPNAVYYAFEEYDYYGNYYYVDTVPGGKGIVMYCTYQASSGPQYTTDTPASNQTYRAVLNPTVSQITANNWVQKNIYGDNLVDNLKKLFYYFETDDAKNIDNSDKQALVWTATGKTSSISYISVNDKTASRNATTVLNNIYETVSPPSTYNLAFFVPTGTQATSHPQPLATGYGADVSTTVNEVVFNNTTKVQNSLKIGKTVTGTAGETDREFTFTISLMDNDWQTLSGTYTVIPNAIEGVANPSVTSITFTNGTATVALKHGQNITITGLPDGFYYTVIEEKLTQDGYTSTLTQDQNGNLNSSGATGAVDVEFNNHKDLPSPSITYEAVIAATKNLDGEVPADGRFTFILKNTDGEEVARKTNDGDGKIVFPLTFDAPGTYTYTIEELNDGQENIVYDTEVKTVTVTVGSESLQKIVDGNSFVGSHVSEDYHITVDGTTQLDVYCIDGSAGYPSGNYRKVLNPTTADLESQVTANNYSDALSENMRKLLYYFDTHSYTDKVGYSTLTKVFRQELIWCLTGNPGQQHWTYTDNLNTILAESNPPSDYAVVMFVSTGNAQPVATGYLPTTEVVYASETGIAEFKNYYEYILPETGGIGTKGYAIGGLLLMGSALLLVYKNYLSAKRRGER